MTVVSLHGAAVAGYEPAPEIIAHLERYLEQAKRGEIDGIAVAISRPNGSTATSWLVQTGDPKYRLHSAAAWLLHDLSAAMSDHSLQTSEI